MTKEIALHCMKSASELERELCEECPIYGQTGCDHCYEDALQYVIAMIEQEPILDKIRAEIKHLRSFRAENHDLEQYCDNFDVRIIFMEDVLQIIDKYKAENEGGTQHERP